MAELVFHTGPMDCGKSTLALQMDYTQSQHGRKGRLFTRQDRSGRPAVTSRLGLAREALEVDDSFDFWTFVIRELTTGKRVDYLICDEAQFYLSEQVDQLARIVDELQIDVYAFGILSDFRTKLFPGSQRLVELADRTETLPLGPLCWCGQKGTHNARTIGGQMVTEGSQVAVGDTVGDDEIRYEVLCRLHHRRKVTKAKAKATLSPDPLPFDNEDWA
ncbi:thymidine kinase [Tessaracoccus oleiagri]|uniref:Thymidine kinase n=1 Tax=Tessaracoccus oleiagri TaxID=686624 RepID=A0A1G9MKM2_9ACTN|nr:thymidine kinase [Tessaracoccus oleiagri]SDL74822.1 thymidine kinase [Tessaracoccus oleiagri]